MFYSDKIEHFDGTPFYVVIYTSKDGSDFWPTLYISKHVYDMTMYSFS